MIKGNTAIRRSIHLLCAMMIAAVMLLSNAVTALADEGGTDKINGTINAFGRTVSWEYAYSEDYFRLPQDEYHHDLARLSLGLAVASFRDQEHPEAPDDHLVAYFEELGFEQIETETFKIPPTGDSISYGFAQLKLEDMTVIAQAVCGGNYGPEWASNLTIGDEERPVGFSEAAETVKAALKDYMERHPAEGTVKLWAAGFSRGGAVTNLTAADYTDAGTFDAVYAYTFATPRTTRNPGNYSNIFNILQKNDVVPKIPLADWGYQRNGTDLFLAAQEIDLDYWDVICRAQELYQEMIGNKPVTNFEINYQLRILFDYLGVLFPDSASYSENLQPLLTDLLAKSDETGNALTVLLEALQRYGAETDENREEFEAMTDYLQTLINVYYLQGGISKLPLDQWDPQFGTYNLFNEHFPYEYMGMMFASDDPAEVFSDNTKYLRLVIYGNVDAEIRSGDKVLKTVLSDGTQLVDGVEAPDSLPYVDYSEEKLVITLPADRSFTVSIQSKSLLPQTVTYTGLLFSAESVRAEADDMYSFLMSNGETAVIKTSTS